MAFVNGAAGVHPSSLWQMGGFEEILKFSFETNIIYCVTSQKCAQTVTSAEMIDNCEHVLIWLSKLWNDILELIGRIKHLFFCVFSNR